MDLLTALVLLRRGLNGGVCLSAIGGEERRFFLFFEFYNIFLNYLKIYVCIYFCVYASSISGTLLLYFQDQNMKGIRVIRS